MKKFLNFTNSNEFNKISTISFNQDLYSPILCSVSGGQDSIATLFIILHIFSFKNKKIIKSNLKQASKKNRIKVIYCHHFWQIKNFFLVLFLFKLNFNLQSPYIIIFPTKKFLNENYSRNWRKKSFYRILNLEKSLNISIGSTKTDIIEKNFNNILRGTTGSSLNRSAFLNYRNSSLPFFSSLILKSYFFEKQHIKKIYFYFKINVFFNNYSKFLLSTNLDSNIELVGDSKNYLFKTNPLRKNSIEKLSKPLFYFFFIPSKLISLSNQQEILRTEKSKIEINSFSLILNGKEFNHKFNLTKPLEKNSRQAVSNLIYFYKLPFLNDQTNFSSNFSRNKIRHQLLPFIKIHFQKKAEVILLKFFQFISNENLKIQTEIKKLVFISKFLKLKLNKIKKIKLKKNFTDFSLILFNFLKRAKVNSWFLKNIFFNYQKIDLNFSQIKKLKKLISTIKKD